MRCACAPHPCCCSGAEPALAGTMVKYFLGQSVLRSSWDQCWLPSGSVDKNPPANAGDMGLILFWEDSTCREATLPVCHNC
ncbi:hypothetical protein JEQ12_004127 [Ovis aries]|uniref:Uncharacterized protein n=1 Tax=Ovis aries TaxID=9940 RepID=A0A835ZW34_SHEEP|nr:hypothetical protein JEQ12_004127 [Ovis aries]